MVAPLAIDRMNRRDYLKASVAGVAGSAMSRSLADTVGSFEREFDAVRAGGAVSVDSRIDIQLPARVENGAVVPIRIESSIADTRRLVLLIDNHPMARVGSCEFSGSADPVFSVHVRIDVACRVTAMISDGQRWYANSAEINDVRHTCSSEH